MNWRLLQGAPCLSPAGSWLQPGPLQHRTQSQCELIELKDLSVNDPIELAAPASRTPPASQHGRPGRSGAVRLVGGNISMESPQPPTGEAATGHHFQPCSYTQLTWCDMCGEFIWGLYKQSLRCSNCSYTCHHRCQPLVQLDCSADGTLATEQGDLLDDSIETDTNVDEPACSSPRVLTLSEIQHKVKEYNALTNSNLCMVVNKDGIYTGFIKVHFQLLRPVSLPPPCESPSSAREEGRPGRPLRRRTSFYLPRDAAKHLHVSSQTQAREVIQALLNKFTVMDNPAKFALFERTERQSQVYMRKLSDDERPLLLRLCAGPSEKASSLVLKENETGDVNWDAFSFPELCNFLRILKREEEEHVRQIVKRYALARDTLKQAMARMSTPP